MAPAQDDAEGTSVTRLSPYGYTEPSAWCPCGAHHVPSLQGVVCRVRFPSVRRVLSATRKGEPLARETASKTDVKSLCLAA